MREKTVGTGITKRVQVSYETPEEQYAYLGKYFSRTFDFEHLMLQPIEKTGWAVLHKAGLSREKLLMEGARIKREWEKLMPARSRKSVPAGLADPDENFSIIQAAMRLTSEEDEDPHAWYAAEWLNKIHFIRAVRERDPDMALQIAFELGQSYGVAVMKFNWELPALRGMKFIEGPKKPRMNALARVMEVAYDDLTKRNGGEPTARKLWEYLPNADPKKGVIQDQTTNNLEWLRNGELQDLDFVGFKKRYGRFRKKLYRKPRRKLR